MKANKQIHGLSGAVRAVHIEETEITEQNGIAVEEKSLDYTIRFDNVGNVVEHAYHNSNGSNWVSISTYSDAGDLLAIRTQNSAGETLSHRVFVYDNFGRLMRDDLFNENNSSDHSIAYTYDSEGRKTREQVLKPDQNNDLLINVEGFTLALNTGSTLVKAVYDEQDALMGILIYGEDRKALSCLAIDRNNEGKSTKEEQFIVRNISSEISPGGGDLNAGGSLKEFCRNGTAESIQRMFSGDNSVWKREHFYDDWGRLKETTTATAGGSATRQEFLYDDQGHIREENSYDAEGALVSQVVIKRDFDPSGNWIVEEILSGPDEHGKSRPLMRRHREILYY